MVISVTMYSVGPGSRVRPLCTCNLGDVQLKLIRPVFEAAASQAARFLSSLVLCCLTHVAVS